MKLSFMVCSVHCGISWKVWKFKKRYINFLLSWNSQLSVCIYINLAVILCVICSHSPFTYLFLLLHVFSPSSGSIYSSVSPASIGRHRPSPSPHLSHDHQAPQTDSLGPRTSLTPPPPTLVRSSLVQSTSFLDSVPVTLTMEPRDWMSADEAGSPRISSRRREEREKLRAAAGTPPAAPVVPRGYEVELKRRPGEGFGFVIASQDVENGRGERGDNGWGGGC